MIGGRAARARGFRVPAGDGERAPRAEAGLVRISLPELGLHAPTDDLGDRHAKPSGAPANRAMLGNLELYLNTHHDGRRIPSS